MGVASERVALQTRGRSRGAPAAAGARASPTPTVETTLSPATPTTSGRADAASPLADHDLARRLRRLPVPPEALPRLVRVVAEEVEAALEARQDDAYSADEILAAGGDEALLGRLEAARAERRRVERVRALGLHRLPAEALTKVLEAARAARS